MEPFEVHLGPNKVQTIIISQSAEVLLCDVLRQTLADFHIFQIFQHEVQRLRLKRNYYRFIDSMRGQVDSQKGVIIELSGPLVIRDNYTTTDMLVLMFAKGQEVGSRTLRNILLFLGVMGYQNTDGSVVYSLLERPSNERLDGSLWMELVQWLLTAKAYNLPVYVGTETQIQKFQIRKNIIIQIAQKGARVIEIIEREFYSEPQYKDINCNNSLMRPHMIEKVKEYFEREKENLDTEDIGDAEHTLDYTQLYLTSGIRKECIFSYFMLLTMELYLSLDRTNLDTESDIGYILSFVEMIRKNSPAIIYEIVNHKFHKCGRKCEQRCLSYTVGLK
jgi:hypothetical protein